MAEQKAKKRVKKIPVLTVLVLLASGLCFFSSGITSIAIYDRIAILQGEYWRLLSSHFVHFSATQLTYNLLVFGVAGSIVEKKSPIQFAVIFMFMASGISTALLLFKPAMIYYGGLSGVACGFVMYCALVESAEDGPWRTACILIIVILPLKVLLEGYSGFSIMPYREEQTFVVMPLSHVTGIVMAFLLYAVKKTKRAFKLTVFD